MLLCVSQIAAVVAHSAQVHAALERRCSFGTKASQPCTQVHDAARDLTLQMSESLSCESGRVFLVGLGGRHLSVSSTFTEVQCYPLAGVAGRVAASGKLENIRCGDDNLALLKLFTSTPC
jgi:hypothetical protein